MRNPAAERPSLLDGWNSPPNLVTYVRILLVLAFIGVDVAAGSWGVSSLPLRWTAAGLFVVAASTDKLDGWMARTYNHVTELGKLMDPIADKLLIGSALVLASCFGELGWWVTILMLVREVGITVMRLFVIDTSGRVIAASKAGKYKTLAQCVGLGLLLMPMWSLVPGLAPAGTGAAIPMWLTLYYVVTYAVIYLALILCLYSGGLYLYSVLSHRHASDAGESPSATPASPDGRE
ncbi:CDP-diacylglycerol--glycerol-3-phosphate 3-phosphatidyltransferase [uncultured Bifidobacterium sp.]|uniref:CDP-diacylglycerol--glycerol-3-phosphate 3-phosphatidyltransferase n=1 Tax=uncultured Bifidobacterium sp. TaxID=165187 RepID=UPI0028DB9B58|nr:CDP-diacylglycerol--glycerol-3-phosphate 3-phosphatidyltransferase [uncultured Bifidobacterium sp.]